MQFGEFSDDDSSKIISIGDDWNLKKSIFLWLLLRYGTSKLDKDATFCSSSFLSVEMYLRSTHETKRVDARTHSLTGECWHSSTKIAACTPVKELIPRESRINSSLGCMRQSFWLCQKRGLMKDLFLSSNFSRISWRETFEVWWNSNFCTRATRVYHMYQVVGKWKQLYCNDMWQLFPHASISGNRAAYLLSKTMLLLQYKYCTVIFNL
jgi:hypothetical protein